MLSGLNQNVINETLTEIIKYFEVEPQHSKELNYQNTMRKHLNHYQWCQLNRQRIQNINSFNEIVMFQQNRWIGINTTYVISLNIYLFS